MVPSAIGWDRGDTYRACAELSGQGTIIKAGVGWGRVKYTVPGQEGSEDDDVGEGTP
jgi:hypothetical protein